MSLTQEDCGEPLKYFRMGSDIAQFSWSQMTQEWFECGEIWVRENYYGVLSNFCQKEKGIINKLNSVIHGHITHAHFAFVNVSKVRGKDKLTVAGIVRAIHRHWTIPVLRAGAALDQKTRWWVPCQISKMIIRLSCTNHLTSWNCNIHFANYSWSSDKISPSFQFPDLIYSLGSCVFTHKIHILHSL